MTADRDDLAEILNAHQPDKVYRSYPSSFRCTCGETVENLNDHLADVVLESDWLREKQRKAWDEGFKERHSGGRWDETDSAYMVYGPNPYRADRVDAEDTDNTTDRT